MMMRGMLAAAFAAGLVVGGVAHAQNSFVAGGGMTVAEIAAVLTSEGLDAEISSSEAAGKIQSELSGVPFEIFSVNCNSAGRCTEFLFICGFDLADGFAMAKINEWNATKIAGRAYLDDEDDPFLDHIISVSGPGDEGAFKEGLYLWAAALDAYIEYIELPSAEKVGTGFALKTRVK